MTHSPYRGEYKVDQHTDRTLLIEIVKKHNLLGTFQDYLNENKSFNVPVYAVWGNHEDPEVIKHLKRSGCPKNLLLLDADNHHEISAMTLFGLGGNFLASKLFQKPIAGQAGKVWATLHEFGCLYLRIKDSPQPRIFVSHVSPGKESLLTRLLIHFAPNIWISGHMGAPYHCIWNQFTIREPNEALAWFDSELEAFRDLIKGVHMTEQAKIAADLILKPILTDDFWFKRMWNFNLPDVHDGYAILNVEDGKFSLDTFSIRVRF